MIKSGLKTARHPNLFLGTGEDSGILFLWSNTSLPDLGSTDRAFGFQSTTPKYWQGSSWASFSSGGGYTTWDELYDNDKTLTIDSTSLTFALTHASNNGLTITGGAASAGNLLAFSNSYAGNDIYGTSGLWTVTSAGVGSFVSLSVGGGSADGQIVSNGAYDLILSTNAAAHTKITITDGTNGNITCAMNGTGKFVISGTTETNTGFQLTNGDAVISDGSLTITDDDNAATVSVTTTGNSNCLTMVADSIATGNVVDINADAITSGFILHLDSANYASFSTGGYFQCHNGTSGVFTIGAAGLTTIAGSAVGTSALVLTAGDIETADGNLKIVSSNTTGANVVDISSASTTTKNLLDISDADGLTTGYIAKFVSNSSDATARYLTYIENTNASASGAIPLGLKNGSTGTTFFIDHNGVTGKSIYIDAETTTETGGIIDIAPTVLTTGYVIDIGDANAITEGIVLNIASTSGAATSADFIKIAHTGSSATLAARTGSALDIASSLTNTKTSSTLAHDYDLVSITRSDVQNGAGGTTTSAGSALYVKNTATQTAGTLTNSSYAVEVQITEGAAGIYGTSAAVFINQDCTTAVSLSIDAESTTSNVVDISAATLTEGKAIDLSDLDAITTGKAIHVDATGNTQTTGILVHIDSGSGVIAGAGRLFLSDHTGTAGTTAVLNEFKSASTADEQILRVTASAALAGGVVLDISADAITTGTCIDVSGLAAFTTGKGIYLQASGVTQTDGMLIHATSASTALTSTGRLLLVDHTGNATVSGIIAEIKTAAADETIALQVTAASLTTGKAVNIVPTAISTGSALYIDGADALTSGDLVYLNSDSADTSARALIKMHNDNSAAVGCVPIEIVQDALISTNFKMVLNVAGQVIYVSDGTTPNGNLSGAAGNLCLGADSGKAYYCTGTTNWTAL